MATKQNMWILDSPMIQGANASIPWTIVFPWATTVTITTADNTDVGIFREGDDTETDLADTHMSSGAHAYSGNSIILRNLASLVSGETYIVSIRPTVDGVQDEWWFKVKCPRTATGRVF